MSESPTNDTKKETIVIRGIVKDKEGTPLPGVTILIKGSTVGVSTDVKGEYVMNVEKRDSLVLSFSFVGMKTKEVKWTGQQTLNVVPEEDVSEVSVVVIGYGTTTKDLTDQWQALLPDYRRIDSDKRGPHDARPDSWSEHSGRDGAPVACWLEIRGVRH
ncbi:MAG: carboxypeptidase-like regulatory domain-containing protein [Butyricimonas paravirosa]